MRASEWKQGGVLAGHTAYSSKRYLLNSLITSAVFKATADWIKTIRKSERLQDYLAGDNIRWQFNLAKSPWWGGLYQRLIEEIKKALHKTLGWSCLFYEAFKSVIMDVERNLNNRPLIYRRIDKLDCHEVNRTIVWQIEVSFKLHDCKN